MTPSTILLLIISALLGVALGAAIQHARERRQIPPSAQAAKSSTQDADNPPGGGEVEELRIWRTQSGRMLMDLDGTRHPEGESLRADQRRRLVNLLVELRPWLEGSGPAPAPAPAAALSRKAEPPPAPVAEKVRSEAVPAKPAVVLKSIVEQINDVLQVRLQDSSLKDQDIRLAEGPLGEVLVMDGFTKYEGIEAVPDPRIQALIRQAVAEWEKGLK